jgi:hypothetical protein
MPAFGLGRGLLFALLSLALVLSALSFSRTRPDPGSGAASRVSVGEAPTRPSARGGRARARRLLAWLRHSARRFLLAFLRYEVGDRDVAQGLRERATTTFAARLLSAWPREPAGRRLPAAARLEGFEVGPLSADLDRALISASARRGPAREELSFLFERRHGAWLASGPAQ